MNLLLDLKNVSVTNVYFMETKPNMLFDGIFTKINYCDEFFTMYGIYVSVPVEIVSYDKPKIDTNVLNALLKLEFDILKLYSKTKPLGYKITYKLAEFMQTKFTISPITGEKTNCLKISGIWENRNNELGLSFKF
jgi:hypothetical protein